MGQSMRIVFEGLDELRKALRDLPAALQAEAATIVEDTAYDAARDLLAAYPPEPGPLRNGVVVVDRSSRWQARWDVKSKSKQASWWEFGTQNRHTQQLWNRGAAPAHRDQGLVPIAIRHRRTMLDKLIEVVKRNGPFEITEEVD
jgi:hypothetical protein